MKVVRNIDNKNEKKIHVKAIYFDFKGICVYIVDICLSCFSLKGR